MTETANAGVNLLGPVVLRKDKRFPQGRLSDMPERLSRTAGENILSTTAELAAAHRTRLKTG